MTPIRRRRRRARTQRNSNNRRSNEYQSDRVAPVWLIFRFNRHGHRDWFKIRNQFQFFEKQQHQQRNHCIIQRNRHRIELRPMLIAGNLNPIKTSLTATSNQLLSNLIFIIQRIELRSKPDVTRSIPCTIVQVIF